jgi:hypothetical protein
MQHVLVQDEVFATETSLRLQHPDAQLHTKGRKVSYFQRLSLFIQRGLSANGGGETNAGLRKRLVEREHVF